MAVGPQTADASPVREESWAGRRVVFTGRLLSLSRREARDAIERLGGRVSTSVSRRTAMVIVGMGGWPLLKSGEISMALRRAEALNRDGSSIDIIGEARFLELIGRRAADGTSSKKYGFDEICEITGIQGDSLRRWEQLSLVRSTGGGFDFEDLVSLRAIAELLGAGAKPATIHRSLEGLAAVIPGTDRPLAQLRIVMENPATLLAELDDHLVAADGQLIWNFDAAGSEPPPIAVVTEEESDAFERGRLLEAEERFEDSLDCYRQAFAREPDRPELLFNMGNVLRATGRLEAAGEMFRLAVALDAPFVECWYNLADVCDELGRLDEAVACLRTALSHTDDFADAYYNLALCHERRGERADAASCWQRYLDLDGDSPWAEVARARLGALQSADHPD